MWLTAASGDFMRDFLRGTKFRIALAVFSCLLLGVFFAAVSVSGSSPVSKTLSFITAPLQNAAVHISAFFNDFNGYFASSRSYAEEVESLKTEVSDLKSQLVDYEKALHKLEAYEDFLEVKDNNPDFTFTPATIVLRDSSDIYASFTINKGSSDGIKVNDPVIYGNALVGVIREVNENTSTVFTLFNPDINASAYEIRTREDCYVESEPGFSADGLLRISGLTKTSPVVAGGIICTSGIGGIYPKDLIIGTIKEVRNDEIGISSYALVTPEAEYSLLTDIFVITDFEGKNG